MTTPSGLKAGGKALWRTVTELHPALDGIQLDALEGACRMRDRADMLAASAKEGEPSALRHEREAWAMSARLLVAMRLPDVNGKRPAAAQGLHGVEKPSKVSSIERARVARSS